MVIHTVIRHIENKTIPLQSFDSLKKAQEWADLQMTYLDKDWHYSIAIWQTDWATIIPCHDKRLRLVKS